MIINILIYYYNYYLWW